MNKNADKFWEERGEVDNARENKEQSSEARSRWQIIKGNTGTELTVGISRWSGECIVVSPIP